MTLSIPWRGTQLNFCPVSARGRSTLLGDAYFHCDVPIIGETFRVDDDWPPIGDVASQTPSRKAIYRAWWVFEPRKRTLPAEIRTIISKLYQICGECVCGKMRSERACACMEGVFCQLTAGSDAVSYGLSYTACYVHSHTTVSTVCSYT